MVDELAQLAGAYAPTVLELDGGEAGELVLRQAQDLEVRASAVERDALLARRRELHRRRRQLLGDFGELLGRNRHGALGVDVRADFRADGDVEIGA
ncbi:hypothetical protein D3C83_104440 [compost metagenome]